MMHKLCDNHTFNVTANSDNLNARVDRSYKRSYDRAMAKIHALHNLIRLTVVQQVALLWQRDRATRCQ